MTIFKVYITYNDFCYTLKYNYAIQKKINMIKYVCIKKWEDYFGKQN